MATHDGVLDNQAGAAFRADANNALAAIRSNNSNATSPSPTTAYLNWYDTTADAWKQRNAANTAWLTIATFDQTNGLIRWDFDKGADIASAATTDIGAATGNSVTITGTVTITGLGTIKAGVWRLVTFAGALTLTHNATSLIVPGAASVTTAAGDMMLAESLGSGNWRVFYQRADGTPLVGGAVGRLIGVQTFTASGTWTPTAGTVAVEVEVKGPGGDGADADLREAGGGGGEGGTATKYITSGLGATETVTVGTPGSASTFGAHCTGNAGSDGTQGPIDGVGGAGGAGGTATGGDLNKTGQGGTAGGGDPAGGGDTNGGQGGGQGGGAGVSGSSNGNVGNLGGGGGGAARASVAGTNTGGAGGDGYVIVKEYS